MKLMVLNGPNLNFLGIREKQVYGTMQYEDACRYITEQAEMLGHTVTVLQSNSEGALIAFCAAQQCPEVDAVISLAGAGYPLDEILQLQLAAQLAPTHMELLMQALATLEARKEGRAEP